MQEAINTKEEKKKICDLYWMEHSIQEYKKANKAPKRAMAKVKFKAYRDLYDSRDSEEGQKRALRMAKSRNRNSVDVFQAKLIKDKDGKTLTESTEIQQRWKEYFEDLMNIENEREQRTIEANYEEMVEPV